MRYISAFLASVGRWWFSIPTAISGCLALYGQFRAGGMTWLPEISPWTIAVIAAVPLIVWSVVGLLIKVVSLQKKMEPKLVLLYGKERIFYQHRFEQHHVISEVRLGVKNESSSPVQGVEVTLANAVSETEDPIYETREKHDLARALIAEDSGTARTDFNPKQTRYFIVAKVAQLAVGMDEVTPIDLVPFATGAISQLRRGAYTLKIRVSGGNSPTSDAVFSNGIEEGGLFFFRPHS